MKIRGFLWGVLGALCLFVESAAAATLVVNGSGQLTGARGIDVGGSLYDVNFLDGSCYGLFDGCDEATDFAFRDDGAKANLAAQALMDQVFVDGAAGLFDSNPNLTLGCSNIDNRCTVYTVWKDATVNVSDVYNFPGATPDFRSTGFGLSPFFNTSTTGYGVFAKWNVATVPVPASLSLLLAGLGGLAVIRRRKAKVWTRWVS